MRKYLLDEMQEQKLLRIEKWGMWLAYWGLLAAIFAQLLINGDLLQVAGELAVFLPFSVYVVAACLKHGIWSRCYAPTVRVNLMAAGIAALFIALVFLFFGNGQGFGFSRLGFSAIWALGTFAACFLIMEIIRRLYLSRRKKLDAE